MRDFQRVRSTERPVTRRNIVKTPVRDNSTRFKRSTLRTGFYIEKLDRSAAANVLPARTDFSFGISVALL
ncbi:MAG: hypothetical protein IPJ84_01750 [Bdellovibrionales bacterium]|nr:hypothetical protein [Bdellovibrionales bacterium]